MTRRKTLVILLIVVLLFSLFACRKKKTEPVVFYREQSSNPALTQSSVVSLGGYAFSSFAERGMIVVSEKKDGETRYGVVNDRGEIVLPVLYSSISMAGDYFFAQGNLSDALYYVLDLKGNVIYKTNEYIEIADACDGFVSVTEDSYVSLYNGKGENVFPGNNLDYSYEYRSCGDFVIAKSKKRKNTFVFHTRTGETKLSFLGSDSTTYTVDYLGGNDFSVIRDDVVSSEKDCDYALTRGVETTYYKQTVYRYTVGVDKPTIVKAGRPLYSVGSRYSSGLTAEDREKYPLKEGYFAVRYYVTDGKKANGSLAYYLGDASLSEEGALPEGISPVLRMLDGLAAAASPSGAIYFVNDKLEVACKIDDAQYQAVVWSGAAVTASKLGENGVRKIGGFDREGREILPFEYSYISAFVGGKAVATKEGKAYLTDLTGKLEYLADETMPFVWDGFYERREGDKTSLISFDGVTLLPVGYDRIVGARRYDNRVFVALSVGEVTDVVVLS